MAATD